MSQNQGATTHEGTVGIDSPKDLGAAIRLARKNAGLRIVDAAMLCGVATQTFVDIEAGRPGVGIGKLIHVANYFGIALFAVPARERNLFKKLIEKYFKSA